MTLALDSAPLPLPSSDFSSETPSSLVEPSGVAWSSFHNAVNRRRKTRKPKALACFLSVAAAVSLLAFCFRAYRMGLSARNTQRALAVGPLVVEDSDEEEERAWILECCLDLEEEYNSRGAPTSTVSQQDAVLSQVVPPVAQEPAELQPGFAHLSSAHLAAMFQTQSSPLSSPSAQPSAASTGWPLQTAGQQLEGRDLLLPYPPPPPFAFDASTAPSTTQTSDLGWVPFYQGAASGSEFVSSSPSLAELGLQAWESELSLFSAEAPDTALPSTPHTSTFDEDERPSPSGLSRGTKRTHAEDTSSDSDQSSSSNEHAEENFEKSSMPRTRRAGIQTVWRKTYAPSYAPLPSLARDIRQKAPHTSSAEEASSEHTTSGHLPSPAVPSTSTELPAPVPHAEAASPGGTQPQTGFIEVDMGSGRSVRIPHPPPQILGDAHPYYRLAPAPSDPVLIPLRTEDLFVHGRGCTTVRDCLAPVRRLLLKSQLTPEDAQQLIFAAERLITYLFRLHRGPVDGKAPNVAAYTLGMRFICMEALVSLVQIFGPAMNPQDWFPRLVQVIPTSFNPWAIKDDRRNTHYLWLALQLAEALEQLKRGQRPPMATVVMLKRALFHLASSPFRFREPEWNPWRDMDI
ncbi:hypothetical protein ACSSS7_003215 [Eimeria intestinalis]